MRISDWSSDVCSSDLRLWKVRCRRAILATGAFERPIAFSGNDIPGVMLASAAQTYALRYGVLPGKRIVVAANNDSGYEAAFARSEEHTSELQSLMRISYAVFCLKKKKKEPQRI